MGVDGQLHASVALPPRMRLGARPLYRRLPEEISDVAHILWLQFMVHVISHDNDFVVIIIIIIIAVDAQSKAWICGRSRCMLSGSGLCVRLITPPEESYRLRCVVLCDSRNLVNEEDLVRWGLLRQNKILFYLITNVWSSVSPFSRKTQYMKRVGVLFCRISNKSNKECRRYRQKLIYAL
jgi:hypothetical protein